MHVLKMVNFAITIMFFICYFYQFAYIPAALFKKKKELQKSNEIHDIAVLIAARNEEKVIGDLLDSIKDQDYPRSAVTVFVVADNCSDKTASIALEKGAVVYKRHSEQKVGKGYALDYLLRQIGRDYPGSFDGYIVLDADNLLKEDYISKINDSFSMGNDIITSYRNSKNFGSNWISAGYALWFLRESRFLNEARYLLGTSCAVSGTGFFFSQKVLEDTGGWPFHTLTEDIEFSIDRITAGKKIAYCKEAVIYDEQPVSFCQSWRQRMRWSKGYIQVFQKYGTKLIRGLFKGSFSCFDMLNTIMPAFVLSGISIVSNLALSILGFMAGEDLSIAAASLGEFFLNMYLLMFTLGLITTGSEWKEIRTDTKRKVLYTFTFPLFMFTYIPIAFSSLFVKVSWKPIRHGVSVKQL